MRTAAFPRNVPVLASLSEELLDRLDGEVGERRVKAGEWILREGGAADSAFIVHSGRVEVIDEGRPDALSRILSRGDVLGELGLLRAPTGSEAEVPGLSATLVGTLTVGTVDTVAAARPHADLVITPPVDGIGLTEWGAIGRARELGRQAASQALAGDPHLASRLGV